MDDDRLRVGCWTVRWGEGDSEVGSGEDGGGMLVRMGEVGMMTGIVNMMGVMGSDAIKDGEVS